MISFYDGQLTDILRARNLTDDPAVQALSLALREGTRLLYRYAQTCYIYCSIDTAPEKVIDILAAELRTQYYDQELPLETKRALVRNTLIWYMTAGTPAAVEELIAVVFGEGQVKEWFEYEAAPYWFKVVTNALLTEDAITYFTKMIRRVKNTRSHIEAIEIHRTIEQALCAGCCHAPQYKPAPIIDGYNVGRTAQQTIYTVAGAMQANKPAAIIDGYEDAGAVHNTIHAGTAQASKTRQEAIREALSFEGKEVYAEAVKTGTAAAQTTKPAAIIEGFVQDGASVRATIYAAVAANSKYTKNTITEGGDEDATTI